MSASPRPTTLAGVVDGWEALDPGRPALTFLSSPGGDRTVTYGDLLRLVRGTAAWLADRGVGAGHRVLVAGHHDLDLVRGFLGSVYLGAVPALLPYVTFYWSTEVYGRGLRRLVSDQGFRAVLAPADRSEELTRRLRGLDARVLGLEAPRRGAPPPGGPGEADPCHVQLSSGTTGSPRGAVVTHRAVTAQLRALVEALEYGPEDVMLGWAPFSHDAGLLIQLLMPLACGGRVITLSPFQWVRRPSSYLQALSDHRATATWMPGFAFRHCTEHLRGLDREGLDLSSLRLIGTGGEPLRAGALRDFTEELAPCGLDPAALVPAYGLAENVAAATLRRGLAVDRAGPQEVVCCGAPVAGTEVRVGDPGGEPLPDREVGEVYLRGTSLFSGWLEAEAPLVDGWYPTGDLGYLAGGELYLCGRSSDRILSRGENLYPEPLEEAALEASRGRVRRAAAFGVEDPGRGTERVALVAELDDRRALPDSEAAGLEAAIRHAVFRDQGVTLADLRLVSRGWLPVTPSGKTARAGARTRFLEEGGAPQEEDDLPPPPPERTREALEDWFLEVLAARGRPEAGPSTNLLDVGLDSLALADLVWTVEDALEAAVPTEEFLREPTAAHLARLLATEEPAPAAASPSGPPSRTRRWEGRAPEYYLRYRGPYLGPFHLPYELGTPLLRSVLALGAAQRLFLGPEVRLVETLAREAGLPAAETVLRSLLANTWPLWREQALRSAGARKRWVRTPGLDRLEGSSRGAVLAVPHSDLLRLLGPDEFLRGRTLVAVGNIRGAAFLQRLGRAGADPGTGPGRTAQLRRARQVLEEGGAAVMALDWDEGTGGVQVPFHGRLRTFRPGAADLALRSGADLYACLPSLDSEGVVTVRFVGPLEAPPLRRAEQVDHLSRLLALRMAEHWADLLPATRWRALHRVLDDPVL